MTTTSAPPAPGKAGKAGTARPQKPTRTQRPVRAKRSPARFALAIALVALGTLTAVWYVSSLAQTTQVVALANDVPYGKPIAAGDLTVVDLPDVSTGLATVGSEDFDSLIGQFAARDLYAGGLLAPEGVVVELVPAPGTAVVGVQLESSQMPSIPLDAGRSVRVVQTPAAQGEMPPGRPESFDAIVLGSSPAPSGDATVVNLQVDAGDATSVAARAATGRLALVVDAGEGA